MFAKTSLLILSVVLLHIFRNTAESTEVVDSESVSSTDVVSSVQDFPKNLAERIREKRSGLLSLKPILDLEVFDDHPVFNIVKHSSSVVSESNLNNASSEMQETTKTCSVLQKEFGEAAAMFSLCAVDNSRPITFCRNCATIYNDSENAYEELKKGSDKGEACKHIYFEKDNLGIIQLINKNILNSWTKSHCDECFETEDGKINYSKLTEKTENFFLTLRKVSDCFNTTSANVASFISNNTCERCSTMYKNLSLEYEAIFYSITNVDSSICMDIVDAMNITRHLWNDVYKCQHYDTRIGYLNPLVAIIIGLLPLIFYLLARGIAVIDDVKLVHPKRKSFVQNSASLQR